MTASLRLGDEHLGGCETITNIPYRARLAPALATVCERSPWQTMHPSPSLGMASSIVPRLGVPAPSSDQMPYTLAS